MTTDHLHSNSAAVPLEVQAAEEAALALEPLKPRRDQLIEALGKVSIADDEDVRRATDKIVLAQALRESADARLQPIGTPYREANHAVRTAALNFTDTLKEAELRVGQAIAAFRKRQREAAARAKNEQAAREAELREKAGLESAPVAETKAADIKLAPVRSDYRGQVFDRKVLRVTINDVRALPDTVLQSAGVIAALESAVRQLAKLTRDIPGATIEDDLTSNVKAK